MRNQNSLLVNLPSPVARDFPLTLTIAYSGRLARQSIQEESIALDDGLRTAERQRNSQPDDVPLVPPEPKWLFSNRNYWYPQNQVTDYATAHIRMTVPAEYHVVASGIPEAGIAEPPRRPRRSKTRRARFRASRIRSTRRSRSGISAS